MPPIFNALLVLHIISGTATLLSALIAILSKATNTAHRWHVLSGRIFFYGMTGIFMSALGMSLIRFNPPMLFVSIFSSLLVCLFLLGSLVRCCLLALFQFRISIISI